MSSLRKSIRAYVKQQLIAANIANVLDRVYTSRSRAVDTLPAILVYGREEDNSITDESPRRLARDLNLTIEVLVKNTGEVEDQIDDICQAVEDVLGPDDRLGGRVADCWLNSVREELSGEGEKPVMVSLMIWKVTYNTEPSTVPVTPLEGVDVDWKLAPPDSVDAQDKVDLEQ